MKFRWAKALLAGVVLACCLVLLFTFLPRRISIDCGGWLSLNVAMAASESQAPTGQVTWTNLDGSYLDVDDDPDSPDGNWGDAVDDSLDVLAHVSFDTPSGNPTAGAGLQNFKVWVKRSTALSSPTLRIDLYESDVFKSATSITASSVTSDSGELFTGTWSAGSLGTVDGSAVEAYIYGTKAGASGSTSTGAEYPVGEVSLSSSPHSDNDWDVTGGLDINDNVYTELTDKSYDIGDQTYLLKVYGFDFADIPNDATIVGVEVNIAGYYAVASSDYDYMKLMDISRNPVGNDVLTPGGVSLQSSETISTFGSSSELWGNSLTPAWVKDADFGVCLGMIATGNNADIFLDWLTMEVFYTDGGTYSSVDVGAVEWNVDYTTASPNISNTPALINYGVIDENTTYYTNGSAPTFPLDDGECYFTVTNNSGAVIDITASSTNFTGGTGWVIAGSAGENIIVLKVGKSGDAELALIALTGEEQAFITGLADTASIKWEIRLETGTFTDGAEKSATVTLTAALQ